MGVKSFILSALLGAIALVDSSSAHGEVQASLFFGANFASDNDVHLTRPNLTDASFENVRWATDPFHLPGHSADAPYYGARLTYWFDAAPNWGIFVDYTHTKVIAERGDVVPASGLINGAPIGPSILLSNVFSHLQFTDGLNMLTLNVAYRWPVNTFFTPYLSLGAGAAIPDVEVTNPGFPATHDYEFTGGVVHGFVGIDIAVWKPVSLFLEYGVSYAQVQDADLRGGGSISTNFNNQHINVGISYAFLP
jgi:lipid A oxidase